MASSSALRRFRPQVPDVLMLLFTVSGQAMGPFIPLQAQTLGMAPRTIGLLLGVQGGAGLVASLAGGGWLGYIGPRRMAFWASAVSFGALTTLWRWPAAIVLALVLAVVWATGSLVAIACQTLVLTAEHPGGRDHAAGMHGFYTSLGMSVGPLLGSASVSATGHLSTVFLIAALACGVATPVALLAPERGRLEVTRPGALFSGILPLPRGAILGLGLVMIAEFAYVAWTTFFPLALTAAGLSPAFVGLVFAVHGAVLSAVRPGLATLAARLSRTGVLAASFALGAIGLGLAAVTRSRAAALTTGALFGINVGFVFPLTMVLVIQDAQGDRVARLLGLRFAMVTAGAMLGPSLTGLVAGTSLPAAMTLGALVCGAAAVWAFVAGRAWQGPGAPPFP